MLMVPYSCMVVSQRHQELTTTTGWWSSKQVGLVGLVVSSKQVRLVELVGLVVFRKQGRQCSGHGVICWQ